MLPPRRRAVPRRRSPRSASHRPLEGRRRRRAHPPDHEHRGRGRLRPVDVRDTPIRDRRTATGPPVRSRSTVSSRNGRRIAHDRSGLPPRPSPRRRRCSAPSVGLEGGRRYGRPGSWSSQTASGTRCSVGRVTRAHRRRVVDVDPPTVDDEMDDRRARAARAVRSAGSKAASVSTRTPRAPRLAPPRRSPPARGRSPASRRAPLPVLVGPDHARSARCRTRSRRRAHPRARRSRPRPSSCPSRRRRRARRPAAHGGPAPRRWRPEGRTPWRPTGPRRAASPVAGSGIPRAVQPPNEPASVVRMRRPPAPAAKVGDDAARVHAGTRPGRGIDDRGSLPRRPVPLALRPGPDRERSRRSSTRPSAWPPRRAGRRARRPGWIALGGLGVRHRSGARLEVNVHPRAGPAPAR